MDVRVNNHLLIDQFHVINRYLRHSLVLAPISALVGTIDGSSFGSQACFVCKGGSIVQWRCSFANERDPSLQSRPNPALKRYKQRVHTMNELTA